MVRKTGRFEKPEGSKNRLSVVPSWTGVSTTSSSVVLNDSWVQAIYRAIKLCSSLELSDELFRISLRCSRPTRWQNR